MKSLDTFDDFPLNERRHFGARRNQSSIGSGFVPVDERSSHTHRPSHPSHDQIGDTSYPDPDPSSRWLTSQQAAARGVDVCDNMRTKQATRRHADPLSSSVRLPHDVPPAASSTMPRILVATMRRSDWNHGSEATRSLAMGTAKMSGQVPGYSGHMPTEGAGPVATGAMNHQSREDYNLLMNYGGQRASGYTGNKMLAARR